MQRWPNSCAGLIHSTDRHYRIGNRGICGGRLHVRLCRRLPFTLAPLAAPAGAIVITLEILLLRYIGKWLGRYPSVRNASDNIRNAMNMLMEFALLIGSIFAAIKMAGYTGFSMAAALYFLNEALGRPVLKIAAPVVAVIITGILLNIFGWIGLFVPQ